MDEVDLRLWLAVVAKLQNGSHDADNFGRDILVVGVEVLEPAADYWLVREVLADELVVYDHRARARSGITVREESTFPEAKAQRLRVSRRHRVSKRSRCRRFATARIGRQRKRRDGGHGHQRRHASGAGGRHAGRCPQAGKHRVEQLRHPLLRAVPGKRDARHQHVIRVIAGVHAGQPHEAVTEQGGADEEDDRERGLHDEQHVADTPRTTAAKAACGRAIATLQRLRKPEPCAPDGRGEPRRESREHRGGRGEHDHTAIQPHVLEPREACRVRAPGEGAPASMRAGSRRARRPATGPRSRSAAAGRCVPAPRRSLHVPPAHVVGRRRATETDWRRSRTRRAARGRRLPPKLATPGEPSTSRRPQAGARGRRAARPCRRTGRPTSAEACCARRPFLRLPPVRARRPA